MPTPLILRLSQSPFFDPTYKRGFPCQIMLIAEIWQSAVVTGNTATGKWLTNFHTFHSSGGCVINFWTTIQAMLEGRRIFADIMGSSQ